MATSKIDLQTLDQAHTWSIGLMPYGFILPTGPQAIHVACLTTVTFDNSITKDSTCIHNLRIPSIWANCTVL